MIVELEIRTYIGSAAFGAQHYYAEFRWKESVSVKPKGGIIEEDGKGGWITWRDGRVYGKLTADEAKRTNRTGIGSEKVKTGDTCFGWLTEEEAIQHAIEKFENTFDAKKDVLYFSRNGSSAPCQIMVGPEDLKAKIKPWYEACNELDFDWDKPEVRKADKEFRKFWDEYEKTHDNRHVEYDEFDFRKKKAKR